MKEDSLIFETAMDPNYLSTNNVFILLQTLIVLACAFIVILVVLRFMRLNSIKKIFVPLQITFIVLSFPIFSGYNLIRIEWIPQLSFDYHVNGTEQTSFERFSELYYTTVPFVLNILKWFLIGCSFKTLFAIYRMETSRERLKFFVPIVNIYRMSKLLWKDKVKLSHRYFGDTGPVISAIVGH